MMPFSNDEINVFYDDIISGRQAANANVVRPMSNPTQPDILPEILYGDDSGDAISIPVKGNSERDVYLRRRGEPWTQLTFAPVASEDPLSHFAVGGTVKEMARVLECASVFLVWTGHATKETVTQDVQRAYHALDRAGANLTVDAIIRQCIKN